MTYRQGVPEDAAVAGLPARDAHHWLVIYRGTVQRELIVAPSAYHARERACVRYGCERCDVAVGLMPDGIAFKKRKRKGKRKR